MKAKWSLGDHYEMMSGQLALSPEDVRLIHIGFQNRRLISQQQATE